MWEPFGRAPENGTAYWMGAPNERGTFSILSTCLITLIMCAYQSLHPNIPEHNISSLNRTWKRARWVFVGVATPELITYIAVREWFWAKTLENDMKKALKPLATRLTAQTDPNDAEKGKIYSTVGDEHSSRANGLSQYASTPAQTSNESGNQKPESTTHTSNQPEGLPCRSLLRKYEWSRAHSFFALMGGFVVDTSNMSINVLDNGKRHATLIRSALKTISVHDPRVLPDISEELIFDSSLPRAFVGLQAIWFCAQVLGRLATDENPISLLELTTFLQAICCLATKIAWWRKPQDISAPMLIDVSMEEHLPFYARLCVGKELHCTLHGSGIAAVEQYRGILVRDEVPSGPANIVSSSTNNFYTFASHDVTADLEAVIADLGERQYRVGFGLYHQQTCFGYSLKITPDPGSLDVHARLKWTDLHCLQLASEWIANAQPMDPEKPETRWPSAEPLEILVDHASLNGSPDEKLKQLGLSKLKARDKLIRIWKHVDPVPWLSLIAAGSVYGGMHLLAWNGPFFTTAERWIWRGSCLVIASFPVAVALFSMFRIIFGIDAEADKRADRIAKNMLYTLLVVYLLVYSAARVFWIVECFINLSHLPLEVYTKPEWSSYIPHVGAG